jgi:hypothetical protein
MCCGVDDDEGEKEVEEEEVIESVVHHVHDFFKVLGGT